jgi:hypothetical protein
LLSRQSLSLHPSHLRNQTKLSCSLLSLHLLFNRLQPRRPFHPLLSSHLSPWPSNQPQLRMKSARPSLFALFAHQSPHCSDRLAKMREMRNSKKKQADEELHQYLKIIDELDDNY